MSDDKNDTSNVNNPISGAIAYGLGGALAVTIGASIRGNSVYNEALTILAGGAITGAFAGLVGCSIPTTNKDSEVRLRLAVGVINTALGLAAFLTAPLMGEQCLNLGTDWNQTVVDGLVGSATVAACSLGVAVAVGCCTYGTLGFFSAVSSLTNGATPARNEAPALSV
jgi:hypothetical protein